MRQNKKSERKEPLIRRIFYFLTSYEKREARILDYAKAHPEKMPEPNHEAPPGEFDKIILTMKERGIEPAVFKEARKKERNAKFYKFIRKPVVATFLVFGLMIFTTVGVSARRAYDFRTAARSPGREDIVWNNDPNIVSIEDDLDLAYKKISDELGMNPLKLNYIPFDMYFEDIRVENNLAIMRFALNGKIVTFVQSKAFAIGVKNSISDRNEGIEVYNPALNKKLIIYSNELEKGKVELSTLITIEENYYYLEGILPEQEFEKILKKISF